MQPTEPHFPESLNEGPEFRALLESLAERLRNELSDDGFGPIEQLVAEAPDEYQATIFAELIIKEAQLRKMRAAQPTLEEYLERFASKAELVSRAWERLQSPDLSATVYYQSNTNDDRGTKTGKYRKADAASDPEPTHFGDYKVLRPLGSGTWGAVYQAQHESTGEIVAIKMLKSHWASDPDCGQAMRQQFSEEAKMMLQFDHPHVVRVISLEDEADPPYIVQQYIDGQTLADWLQTSRLTIKQSVECAIQIADGLAHIHSFECWHRDLKPANILLDQNNHLYLADFGLALDEAQRWSSNMGVAGTYPYMSPEQIKGATHRLNARCDIWALGVVLYEMLTGRRPFRSQTREQLCEDVTQRTPPAPRELNQAIPRELNRLCMQCLSKRDSDRPHTAADVRDDLTQILQELVRESLPVGTSASAQALETGNRFQNELSTAYPIPTLKRFTAEQAELYLRMMPRGYATADELPELITFWKSRIVENNPDQTFTVGIMVGVSGCGKSSMLEAGLVPALPGSIIPILIEASETDTEVRILNKLRRALPESDIDKKWSLVDWTFRLRSGNVLPPGKKVVLILDQFEQWLNTHGGDSTNQLLDALHQCDGEHLQAIVCVREGFHATLMRFVDALGLVLDADENYATAHRFTPDHARFVLTQFGRGLKRVDNPPTSQQQAFIDATIDALAEADRGVVCVRLVVLALVMQDRPWSIEELNQLGGLDGIGSQFLIDCFEGRTASEQYRRYLPAAMRVLAELLPAEGLEIKDVRSYDQLLSASELDKRQFDDLLNILVRKLFLLTPVEPTTFSPSSHSPSSNSHSSLASGLYYQCTHDFLVPSIRDWLSRKLCETQEGRAQLRLQELTTAWTSKPENRNLPSLWEWITIRRLTDAKKWKVGEQTVMRRASRLHLSRLTAVVVMLGLIAASGLWMWRRVDQNRRELLSQKSMEQEATRIEGLVGRLVSAEPNQLSRVISELNANSDVASTYLSPLLTQPADTLDNKRSQLHARLASVARDKSLIEPLLEELQTNKVTYIGPIREQLRPYAGELSVRLWGTLREERAPADRRFRAGLALADYVPESDASWSKEDFNFIAQQLVSANAEFQPLLRENLRPIARRLLPSLTTIFGDSTATEAQRLSAANAFADYAASDIDKLSKLLLVATPEQYAVLYPLVSAVPSPATISQLSKVAATLPPDDLGTVPRIAFGQRRANAAATMLRLGEGEKVLPVFDWTDDPEAMTQFIFRCKPRGIGVERLLDLLDLVTRRDNKGLRMETSTRSEERSTTSTSANPNQSLIHASGSVRADARYALLLAIGEYAPSEIPDARREALIQQLADWYANDPSSGVHAASRWLLQHLGEKEIVARVDQTQVPFSPEREWFTLAIEVNPTSPANLKPENEDESVAADAKAEEGDSTQTAPEESKSQESKSPAAPLPPKTFYYTFIVFPSGDYTIGALPDQPDRQKDEVRHTVTLTRPFAMLDREITFEELIAFSPVYERFKQQIEAAPSDAALGVHWYDSVAFCRWLGQQMGLAETDQCYADPEMLDKQQYPRDPKEASFPWNWPLDLSKRGFRLPTESEWEAAARSGARTSYSFGSEVALLDRFGWFVGNSGKRVHSGREKRPNVRGLFDMHGNLYEWTHDLQGDYEESHQTDPLGAKTASYRVLRGGSWMADVTDCLSASRSGDAPLVRGTVTGFRLALVPLNPAGSGAEARAATDATGVRNQNQ